MAVRSAGLLLHITSLPGRFPVGDLGPAAEHVLEWAARAGLKLWQVLPVQPTGGEISPYGARSAFAGNPLLISPERVVEDGLCTARDLEDSPHSDAGAEGFRAARDWKDKLLRRAWERLPADGRLRSELSAFRESASTKSWLGDWALFAAVKATRGGAWMRWPRGLASRDPGALAEAKAALADEVAYQEFLQFLFFRQWSRIRAEAQRLGIAIIGDVPIYLAQDSADVWTRRDLFSLQDDGMPDFVAGVPPDAFTSAGQLWGYPLYRWDRIEQDGFAWWIDRMRAARELYDIVRIDHFRAFAAYWAVPAGAADARGGEWREAPGRELWRSVFQALPDLALIAEDLGTITPDVEELRDSLEIPGMKVLQFAFSENDSPHLPHRHVPRSVVYTGTHDNDTTRGWFASLSLEERDRVRDYLGGDGHEIEWDLIRAAFASVSERAVVPIQDVFSLGSAARMNHPGRPEGNWIWRAREEDFTPERAARLKRLADVTGRN
ncbi:MAG TPA: 4-alpha-glucanotransferase [Thermoanaerobaculia bacterium]